MRGPRISYPGAVLHVYNRFVDKHPFFKTPEDYTLVLDLLFEIAETFEISVYAYAIMPNHFHFIMQTHSGELSRFFCRVFSRVAKTLNKRHERSGHLFQGRTKSLIIQNEKYFHTAVAYVLLNPMRAGLSRDILAYRWSSAAAMLANDVPLDRERLLEFLFSTSRVSPQRVRTWLKGLVPEQNGADYDAVRRGGFIADSDFRQQVLYRLERRKQQRGGLRRKTDRMRVDCSWREITDRVNRYVAEHEELMPWTDSKRAKRFCAWYVAVCRCGWKLEKLRTECREAGAPLSRYAMAIKRIDSNQKKRVFARKVCRYVINEIANVKK